MAHHFPGEPGRHSLPPRLQPLAGQPASAAPSSIESEHMTIRILHGDCREVMATLPESSVDAIVCDPPYELTGARPGGRSEATRGAVMGGFMGMKWDGTGVAFDLETWRQALRVLKPGGHLLAFSGTRTYHRMACAIEDAGFEVRDQIGWLYGSGFPKSHNLTDGWQGWGTALKPAWEPICVARKPLIGTVAANVLAHGTGALNIDGCRVPSDGDTTNARANKGSGMGYRGDDGERGAWGGELGRWPANIIHDGSDEVLAAFPQAPGQLAKASSSSSSRKDQNVYGAMARGSGGADPRSDTGSAARFFYTAKANGADRTEGLHTISKAGRNHHPTVKPTDLMRYLCRLVTPPGGTVLDPFMGSGSTLKAAELEGFKAIGIELDPDYIEIARRRIASDAPLFAEVAA